MTNRRKFIQKGLLTAGATTLSSNWAYAKDDGPDYFTLAVLPDTQNYSYRYPDVYTSQTRWLKENAQKYRIPFVCHEGDIVQFNDVVEWERAVVSHKELDGNLPYGLNVGNHDFNWTWVNGKRGKMVRDTCRIDQFFPPSKYDKESWWGGCFENRNHNSYQYFEGPGGLKFLVLNIEFAPRDIALDWGTTVIEKHPDHRVIVITHAYMDNDDTRLGEGDKGVKLYFPDDNDGDSMWEKFVRKHKNIFLVMSGHVCRDSRNNWKFDTSYTETGLLTSKGDHGNEVHQILADYQSRPNGGDGFLRLMRFTPENNEIEVKTYSPFKDEWLIASHNQFTLPYSMT
jgi:hypothetical protein